MSYDYQIDKDRLYFTQCNDTFPNRCPECTSTKILRHCKIYHNFPAVWKHIKQDHKDIPENRLDEIAHVENSVFKAFKWNIFPKWEYSEAKIRPATSSSSILIDGRTPRIDMLENLEKIANLLKTQSEHFPRFKPRLLSILVEKAIGPRVDRTKNKYIDCITRYSEKDKLHGVYVVTEFCEKLGA